MTKEEKRKYDRKRYYESDPQKWVEQATRWRKANPEKYNKSQRKWYHDNIEEQRKRGRQYFRKKYEIILGYEIKDGEVVHHIDMDHSNNNPENLYIYSEKSEHSKAHWSLNNLMPILLRKNIIRFENGRYYLEDF